MKFILMNIVLGLSLAAAQGGPLQVVTVASPANECFFNTNCTNVAQESLTPIFLPFTGSNGLLRTRVLTAETNAPAAGYYGYEYTLDLSGLILDTNHPVCLTNLVECRTNRTESHTNRVTCRTNLVGVVRAVTCVTNRIPATNVLTCVTNFIPGTNIVNCYSNATGVFCVTNVFPPTNYVVCTTTRFSARKIISCQTNIIDPGHFVVQCRTNRVETHVKVVTCSTSLVHCPGSPPCITSLRLKVGRLIAPADFNGDGTNDDAYVVLGGTNGPVLPVMPSAVERSGSKLVLTFDPPLCPGQGSVTIGFLSLAPPHSVDAKLRLTGGDKIEGTALGPQLSRLGQCDFSELATAITNLPADKFAGSTSQIREQHRALLLGYLHTAATAAIANDKGTVIAAITSVVTRLDGRSNDWVTKSGADALEDALDSLLDCLEDTTGHDFGHDDDHDDDHHD